MSKADRNKSGIIFNIQKFSVNDGPGIRTTVFFKGCPLKCAWCANPESQLPKAQVLWHRDSCLGCHHCLKSCPHQAIFAVDDGIRINTSQCQGCGKCISQCPGKALEMEGEIKTVDEILQVVLQDRDFYEESGGGITLSGGEILLQADFAQELLLAAKEEGLHTCCETTGFASPHVFQQVAELVDDLLFDMKHWDSQRHIAGTGVSNELPLKNMAWAIAQGKAVLPRIPVIPCFNDSLEDAAQFSALLHKIKSPRCQLLPFHQFGENKYQLLNKKYAYENLPSLHPEDLTAYRQIFIDHGIDAFF